MSAAAGAPALAPAHNKAAARASVAPTGVKAADDTALEPATAIV
jgi:hypothetical protein